jgi:hypothetical protein
VEFQSAAMPGDIVRLGHSGCDHGAIQTIGSLPLLFGLR